MKRVNLEPAYVLHRRPYRETSFLVEVITGNYGRLSLIARGVRKARSVSAGLLQPFMPLLVSWVGNGELVTPSQIEANGPVKRLQGDCLFAGFYLNELLMCLLQKWDAHASIYGAYETALAGLTSDTLRLPTLREFELFLLEELGYGLLPKSPQALGQAFHPDHYYRFIPEHGLLKVDNPAAFQGSAQLFSGQNLLAIGKKDWTTGEALKDAKRLIHFVLTPLLGRRQIHSRQLIVPFAHS